MFNLTLHDHLQLTFSEILQRYDAHASKALTHARWSRRLRATEAFLVGCVSIAATGVAFGRGHVFAITAAALAGLALLILLVQLSVDLDRSAREHAASSAQLFGLRERYRSLLSDLHDGALSVADARVCRDKLLEDFRAIHEAASDIELEDVRAA